MTGLSVGLVAVVAILQTAIATRKQPGQARLLWRDGFIIGALFLLVGGWWYWRNYQLYGDFFQQGLYKIYFGVDPQPLSLSDFLYTLSAGEVSFWATFGWLNIVAPDWVYGLYRIISRIGLIGVALAAALYLLRRLTNRCRTADQPLPHNQPSNQQTNQPTNHPSNHPPFIIIHLVFPVALAFSLTRLVATEGGLQGRQLLPALGSIAIVVVWGWWVLTPGHLRLPVSGLLAALLLGLAVWLPYGVVAPEYTPRPLLTQADLPDNLPRLDRTYLDGKIRLIGVELGADVVRPGQRVPVTAYWQVLQPVDVNYSVFVHLIGRNYQTVGQFNTYPGLGLRPTSTLQPGQIVRDTYPVLVNGGSQTPTRLLVNVGLFDFKAAGRPGLLAVAPDGREVPATVGQLKLVPQQWPDHPDTPLAEFTGNIWLAEARVHHCPAPTHACTITFTWVARGQPAADYTVFVQLWQDGQQVTGFDAPPLNGDYPTSLWTAGEVIVDPHRLSPSDLPPGEYRIQVGLYNFSTGERLPATSGGEPLPNHALDVGTIHLE
jgi:hypothetical protein